MQNTDNIDNTYDASLAFSQNFIAWFKNDFPGQKWLKEGYVSFDADMDFYGLNIDFAAAYKTYFKSLEYSGVLEQTTPSFYDVGMLIELTYGELILPASRDAFAQLINLRLREFNAPLKFVGGRFESMDAAPPASPTASAGNVGIVHKAAAALVIIVILLSVLRGC